MANFCWQTTAKRMQQQQFTHDSRLAGWCWGFGESFVNQQRVTYHAGGLPGFISLLHLFPDLNLGLFISNNGRGNITRQLLIQFCDRYFPVAKNINQPAAEDLQSLKRYQGSYRSNRYPRRTFGKINLLGFSPLRLKAINHLGIVAGIIDELSIVDIINQELEIEEQEIVNSGEIVKAIILNGLGFVSQPLYLFPKFFEDKATEHLRKNSPSFPRKALRARPKQN